MTKSNKQDLSAERTDYAEERTEYAEDRTILANERTFAGWMRTGYAAAGLALGFQALFNRMNPEWVPRAIATAFFLSAIVIFISAERRHCAVLSRLSQHQIEAAGHRNMRFLAYFSVVAIVALIVVIWRVRLSEFF